MNAKLHSSCPAGPEDRRIIHPRAGSSFVTNRKNSSRLLERDPLSKEPRALGPCLKRLGFLRLKFFFRFGSFWDRPCSLNLAGFCTLDLVKNQPKKDTFHLFTANKNGLLIMYI